jgi:hypothetical protein
VSRTDSSRQPSAADGQVEPATSAVEVDAALYGILKRYDRIGFGRRGVLDAQPEIQRLAAELSSADRARFRQIVQRWIEPDEAERVAAPLHYNLPEHVQMLAIRLCASVPIPESLPLLRRLDAAGAFTHGDAGVCRDALHESLARLSALSEARES